MSKSTASIAYFSMEIGLETAIPTYAGGLGVLAGDTIRSAADLGMPMVAVTLLHRRGYFRQKIDAAGWQTEVPVVWPVDDYLSELPKRIKVEIEGRPVIVRTWKYDVKGINGHVVPVYLLDTDLQENTENDRTLTHYLYGGDQQYRLCQEVVLGIGGVRMLRALGYGNIQRFHMNEGHASLLVLELLFEKMHAHRDKVIRQEHIDEVRPMCVFTTHTPVPAGHDKFSLDLVHKIMGPAGPFRDREQDFCTEGVLNLTYVALAGSHFVNGVAKKHREVSQHMFATYQIDSITNGIHVATWSCRHMKNLYDRYITGWREDNLSLRYALSIPREEIWQAHAEAKKELIEYVNRAANVGMDRDLMTIGFARRATTYKRPDLLFHNMTRLIEISKKAGPIQIIYAGKAHPRDQDGKALIQSIHKIQKSLKNNIKIAYLEEYDMALGKLFTAGTDLWLNTPKPPLEASGTSGMKAALNGVPSFSILDGWWIEGCIEGITGWAIGHNHTLTETTVNDEKDAEDLYDKLEKKILPLFYNNRAGYIDIMRHCIALNGSFFNTERMLNQYVTKAYFV